MRITAPLGETTLNFVKATDGLAHGAIISPAERQSAATQAISNNGSLSFGTAALTGNAQDNSSTGNGNAGGNGNGLSFGNSSGVGNGLALGNGNGAGNGLALGNGNGNAIGIALGKGRAKGKI